MPVIYPEYQPPWWLRNGHVHSIYPSIFRKVVLNHQYRSERLETPDDDFLDVDWYTQGKKRLLIVSHGLEGHSQRPYVLGVTKYALHNDWDVLAWNFRACNGAPNRKLATYHSGGTEDLSFLVDLAVSRGYEEVSLCGFSIGGNKTLLYLGREAASVPEQVSAAVVLSVPCDLVSSSAKLALPKNQIYMKNFLKTLRVKLEQKQKLFPSQVSLTGFSKIKTFEQFDDRYTAPMNGFASALDYWQRSSSKPYLKELCRPVCFITSYDDPFLTPECFPEEEAIDSTMLHMLATNYGGHVGFSHNKGKTYWSEQQTLMFLNSYSAVDAR
jgi:predicted alpha/beta-fold hydrolase